MIYLNVILTILCLILLSFLVLGFILIKKYGETFSGLTKTNKMKDQFPNLGDPKNMEESMKMINNLMKTFGKK